MIQHGSQLGYILLHSAWAIQHGSLLGSLTRHALHGLLQSPCRWQHRSSSIAIILRSWGTS